MKFLRHFSCHNIATHATQIQSVCPDSNISIMLQPWRLQRTDCSFWAFQTLCTLWLPWKTQQIHGCTSSQIMTKNKTSLWTRTRHAQTMHNTENLYRNLYVIKYNLYDARTLLFVTKSRNDWDVVTICTNDLEPTCINVVCTKLFTGLEKS